MISLKAVSSASSFSRSSAVGGADPSPAKPRAISAEVASLATAARTCGPYKTDLQTFGPFHLR